MNDPLSRLERSHRRLEEACDALSIAATDRDLATIADVASFFSRQARRHEEDEERSLFPRLRGAGLDAELDRLSAAHRAHAALVAELETALDLAGRGAGWDELERAADALVRAYRAHVEEEEAELFPRAREALGASAWSEIAAEMEGRRGRGP